MLGVTVKIQSADNKSIQVRNNLRCLSFKSYMLIKSVCLALSCASQAAQAHNAKSYIYIYIPGAGGGGGLPYETDGDARRKF